MATVSFRHKAIHIPNLEKVSLINKYTSYLKLVRSGFIDPQARGLVNLTDKVLFKKAEHYYNHM